MASTKLVSEEENTDVTTCSICFETFKFPKHFPCLHSFCEQCVKTYITTSLETCEQKKGVKCPVCRVFIYKPDNCSVEDWSKKLPTNHVLVNLIDMNKTLSGSKLCSACARDSEKEVAQSWCLNCCEALCAVCVKCHRKSKATASHKFVDIQNEGTEMSLQFADVFCTEHPSKLLEAYCYDHSKVCCMSCVMLKHRKCNHVGSVEDAAKEKKSSVVTQEIEFAFSQMKDDLEIMIEERDENIKAFEGSIEQMKEDANKLFKEISTHIEWLKYGAFDEISALQKKILHEIKDDKQDLQHRISAVKNHLALFHTNVKYASPAQFLIAMEKLSEQKEICEEFTDEKKNGKRTVIVKCRMDKTLSKISKEVKRFLAYRVLRVQASSLKEPELLENITTKGRLSVSGIAFLTNDYLLASICGDKCLELWNDQYELVSTIKLSASPYGVKLTNDKDGAVVLYGEGLKFFTVHDDELREMKMLKMNSASNDFVQVQKKYYICSKGKILVYNDRRDFYMKHLPVAGDVWYTCAVDDSRLCYTLYKGDKLFCITLKGSPVFEYSHDRLRNTTGVTVDGKKNIYVCGYDTKNVHQLDKDGKLLKIVLFNIPGRPWCISFNKTGEKVAIGCPRKVLIYESKDFAG